MAKRKHNTQIEQFEGDRGKSNVDTLGYQTLERRIMNLQHAGIVNRQAKEDEYDGTGTDYTAPPMRGIQPDLADLSEIVRENSDRVKEIKERHLDNLELIRIRDEEREAGEKPASKKETKPAVEPAE